MLTITHTRRKLPPGWPSDRYVEYNRAIKVTRIVDYLLREQVVHAAEQATDDVITTAAREIAAGHTPPSAHTCQSVRETLARLIPTPLPVLTDADAMEQIHALLSGHNWTPDHINRVAAIVNATGRTVDDI
ncbi:hypothetical protein OG618_37345 (plasmid) [Kitasatospora sp. NBC_01246]|uniref:hypothetical protein n=1 Tax=Kitasatospora sp. NBC_01246 TaxID=2903570 RepID=UPI002E380FD3|nr:hypothetical protein [Kitasatospora sp. NBC_01246]